MVSVPHWLTDMFGAAVDDSLKELSRQWQEKALILLVAMVLAAVASFCLCAGLGLYLATLIAPWQAAAATGGLVLLVVLALLAITRARGRESAVQRTEIPSGISSNEPKVATSDFVSPMLESFSNARKSDVVVASLIAGVVLGACPELRSALVGNGKTDDSQHA